MAAHVPGWQPSDEDDRRAVITHPWPWMPNHHTRAARGEEDEQKARYVDAVWKRLEMEKATEPARFDGL